MQSGEEEATWARREEAVVPLERVWGESWWSCVGTCLTKHGFMGHAWSWTMTGNSGVQTFSSSKERMEKPLSWDVCPLHSNIIQWNTAHVFLNHYMEAEDPRSWRRELLREDGDSETHKGTFQRGWRPVCAAGLTSDKDMGNFWAWFWFIAWWGAKEMLGLVGEQGSVQESSQHPPTEAEPC